MDIKYHSPLKPSVVKFCVIPFLLFSKVSNFTRATNRWCLGDVNTGAQNHTVYLGLEIVFPLSDYFRFISTGQILPAGPIVDALPS